MGNKLISRITIYIRVRNYPCVYYTTPMYVSTYLPTYLIPTYGVYPRVAGARLYMCMWP